MDSGSSTDVRLGTLLDRYQRMREGDPRVSVERLKDEAGSLYAELAELAACLDALQDGDVPAATTGADTLPGARRRWVVGGLLIVLVAVVAWFMTRPEPSRLLIRVHPRTSTTVLVDGAPYNAEQLSPGTHRVDVARKHYAPQTRSVTLSGEDVTLTLHLVPLDSFIMERLRPLLASYGVAEIKNGLGVPRPVGIGVAVDIEEALTIRHPEALEMELGRFPPAIRGRDDVQYLAMRQLYRAGLFAECYRAARALADRHPKRPELWHHCALALWGLELVETDLYRDVIEKMNAASAGR